MDGSRIAGALATFEKHLGSVDELTLAVLKGHLIIEEHLDRIISRFVFHPEKLEAARLTFAQQVWIARSISLDEHENSMWHLILAINALRNDLAHALDSPKREAKVGQVLTLLEKESQGFVVASQSPSQSVDARVLYAISLCVGFLTSFDSEVERFRRLVDGLDQVVNPHRHEDSPQDPGHELGKAAESPAGVPQGRL